jgi:hypothetical protein
MNAPLCYNPRPPRQPALPTDRQSMPAASSLEPEHVVARHEERGQQLQRRRQHVEAHQQRHERADGPALRRGGRRGGAGVGSSQTADEWQEAARTFSVGCAQPSRTAAHLRVEERREDGAHKVQQDVAAVERPEEERHAAEQGGVLYGKTRQSGVCRRLEPAKGGSGCAVDTGCLLAATILACSSSSPGKQQWWAAGTPRQAPSCEAHCDRCALNCPAVTSGSAARLPGVAIRTCPTTASCGQGSGQGSMGLSARQQQARRKRPDRVGWRPTTSNTTLSTAMRCAVVTRKRVGRVTCGSRVVWARLYLHAQQLLAGARGLAAQRAAALACSAET